MFRQSLEYFLTAIGARHLLLCLPGDCVYFRYILDGLSSESHHEQGDDRPKNCCNDNETSLVFHDKFFVLLDKLNPLHVDCSAFRVQLRLVWGIEALTSIQG